MKSNQSQAFRHAQVYVHGLYGSAGGPFTEVVEAGDEGVELDVHRGFEVFAEGFFDGGGEVSTVTG